MGGAAFLINGSFDVHRASATSGAPSFFDRLRGRKSPAISRVSFPNGRSMLEYPADTIQAPLADDYLAFVRERLAKPSRASQVVLDYLQLGQPRIYLRADRAPGETDGPWYVQVTFSGAAGMAETSARVGAHWAALWYAARGAPIREAILAPVGFFATAPEALEGLAFADAGEVGYAELEDGTLAIDAAFLESHADPDGLVAELDRRHRPALLDGRCRCQMCAASVAEGAT